MGGKSFSLWGELGSEIFTYVREGCASHEWAVRCWCTLLLFQKVISCTCTCAVGSSLAGKQQLARKAGDVKQVTEMCGTLEAKRI